MTDFRERSKTALRNLSVAAEWMMRRNVGSDHFWRSTVLTAQNNSDPDKSRPVFDTTTAQEIFDKMIRRGLLVERKVDATGVPAYVMNYDLEGWDKAVSDGRWIRGRWLLLKRNWLLILFTFILTCFISTLESRMDGFIDGCIDSVTATDETNDVKRDSKPEKGESETGTQKTKPNKAVNPSGGSGGN